MSDQAGKHVQVGHKVHYTDSTGKKHEATVKQLNGTNANLEATVDGQHRQFTSVPHDPSGGFHTWDHLND